MQQWWTISSLPLKTTNTSGNCERSHKTQLGKRSNETQLQIKKTSLQLWVLPWNQQVIVLYLSNQLVSKRRQQQNPKVHIISPIQKSWVQFEPENEDEEEEEENHGSLVSSANGGWVPFEPGNEDEEEETHGLLSNWCKPRPIPPS
jgi:hypothetical protein